VINSRLILLFASAIALKAAPQLVLSTTSVGPIQILPGANGTSQTVTAQNTGTGSLTLSAGSSASWLAPTIGSGRACAGGSGTCYPITLALNTSALAAGSYTGYVLVSDPNAVDSPQEISVSVNIAGVPGSATFYVTPVGGPVSSTFQRVYTPGGPLSGTATTQSGGNWLSLINGGLLFNGYAIQVAAQHGQAVGAYTGSLVLSGSSTQTINVTLNVTNAPIVEPVTSPVLLSGSGGNASAVVTFTNQGSGTLSVTAATATSSGSGGNFLSASVAGPNSIKITAAPGSLAAGLYAGAVTITSNAANNSQISVPVIYLAEGTNPMIFSGGVTNIGNFASGSASPGEILTAFGDLLAPAGSFTQNSGLPPLAKTLNGVQVLVNGSPAPLYFTSEGQVAFQLPYETPAGTTATVQVVSGANAGNIRPVSVVAATPIELIWPASVIPGGYAIAVNATDGSLTLPSPVTGFTTHAAKPGDTLTIYCEGLGQTSPPAVTGAAATAVPLEQLPNVTVTFGGGLEGGSIVTTAAFTGLTPTAVGLYQVNVTIPPGILLSNALPVTITQNGVQSNAGLIAVSN